MIIDPNDPPIELRRNGQVTKITDDFLYAYHIAVKEHNLTYPSYAGVLLFGKKPTKIPS